MISGVFGLPGAGKSTFLTWLVLRALKGKSLYIGHFSFKRYLGEVRKYDRVFSNIPIDGTYQLDFNSLGKYDFSNSLLVIDEIGTLCDCRKFKDFDDDLRDFLSLHRHYKCDIIYCSQSLDTDKKIRDRTALVFYIQKRGAFTRIQTIRKDWMLKSMKEIYEPAPPLACTFIWRRLYYSAFDSFDAKPLPDNPAPLWSDIMEVHKYIPLHKQLAEKARCAGRSVAGAVLRRVAAVRDWRKRHDRRRENDSENLVDEYGSQD